MKTDKGILYKNIMLSVSKIVKQKLNESLLDDIEDGNEEDDSEFANYDERLIKVFKSYPDSEYMNNYTGIGDIIMYNKAYKLFYIIKNNKSIDEIKNFEDKNYGKVIGICGGKGLWVSTEFDYYKGCQWTIKYSRLYEQKINVASEDDGWKNTTFIYNYYIKEDRLYMSTQMNTVIWCNLYDFEVTGRGKHVLYLPAKNQLEELYQNNNILKLPKNRFWSSTQVISSYYGDAACAYAKNYYIDKTEKMYKDSHFFCIALIHFK